MSWESWRRHAWEGLERSTLVRDLRPLGLEGGAHVTVGGRSVALFAGNDYLGLASHPQVRAAAAAAAESWGSGPRGSPLVCGHSEEHAALESDLAALVGAEDALLFPTGFAANLAVLSALADDRLAIFSDELNHASIVDGCRLARARGAEVHVWRHRDVGHLAELMALSHQPRMLIVTEGVFSMDGDVAPLAALDGLARSHGALLVVDEAHATLVFGERGGGASQAAGIEPDLRVGTLSKAVGAQGGFVAGPTVWKQWLLNRGRSYIFSTALPVPVVAAARAALRVAREQPELRDRLWQHVAVASDALGLPGDSPILPVILGSPEAAVTASATLLEAGYLVMAMRPPTVPVGTSRLRITLSAAHTEDEVAGLCAEIRARAAWSG